jgi:biopolymer transport protein ExbB
MSFRLLTYLHAAGWLILPLALVTFVIWYRYFVLLTSLRSELHELECEDTTFTRRILGIMESGLPFPRAFEEEKSRRLGPFAGALNTITALVVAAPLLGLLGTVQGIIETFVLISGQIQVNPDQFGGGISRALITTQIGLSAAIPGTFAVAHLRRLYHRIQNRVALLRTQLAIENANFATSGGR